MRRYVNYIFLLIFIIISLPSCLAYCQLSDSSSDFCYDLHKKRFPNEPPIDNYEKAVKQGRITTTPRNEEYNLK